MAYNPFDFFRRNQKTAFAALTIFVMFTFVLSFGQGDFFQAAQGWIRGLAGSRGKEVMATIDGRKIYDADLAKHEDNRALAEQFMRETLATMTKNLDDNLRENAKTASKSTQAALENFLRSRPNYLDMRMIQFYQQNGIPINEETLMSMQQQKRAEVQGALRKILTEPNTNTADQDLAKAAMDLVRMDAQAEMLTRSGGFFAQVPNGKSNEDRLEFELWLRKADKLGITIRPDDAPAMVKDELGSQLTAEVWNTVEKSFGGKSNFSRSKLLAALADEFKVKTAFNIVYGKEFPPSSPYETFRFFKEQTDAATFTMMSVPAENFLDKVTATPTESELRDLFDKYRNVEPDPSRETPGFREPRKLKIAWLEVKGDEPYFKKLGADAFQFNEAGVGLAALSFGPLSPLTAPFVATMPDPQLQAAYAGYRVKFEDSIRNKWYPFRPTNDEIIDSSVIRPTNIAAALGTLVGSHLTNAGPFVAGLTVKERAAQFERNDRARVLAMLLSPASVAGTNVIGNTLAGGAAMPKPLPLAVVRNDLLDQVKVDVTRKQAEADVQNFAKELTRLGAKKDKSEARSYADKFIAERGLKTGGSTDYRDQYTMGDDPGLTVLADKLQRGHGMSDIPIPLGPRFFVDQSGRAPTLVTLYEPQTYPDLGPAMFVSLREGEPTYLTWRTDVTEAATPREFATARPKVEAAWKRAKARELAKAAAEELKKKIDEKIKAEKAEDARGKIDQIIRDAITQFEAQHYGNDVAKIGRSRTFFLDKVAPIRLERDFMNVRGGGEQPVPYGRQHLLKKELQFPSQKMGKALLDAKDKPLGTTLLEADAPTDIHYVGVLLDRDRTDLELFRARNILDGQTPSPVANAIRAEERRAAFRKDREATIALLKAEFKVANESEKLKEKTTGASE